MSERDNETAGTAETEPGPDWSDMTRECLVDILSRLTLEERWKGPMMACKSWLSACRDPVLHAVLDLETRFEATQASMRWWFPDFERKIDSIVRSVVDWSDGNLAEIRVRHCTDRSISHIADRCPNLKFLSIKSCPRVTDASMEKMASGCPKLWELDISYCYEISDASLSTVGRMCPDLKILKRNLMNWLDPSEHNRIVPREYLDACPQDGNSEAKAIGKYMPQLVHLELRFSKITVRGLEALCQGCQDLEHLDLFGCCNLTSRDIIKAKSNLMNLKNLKELKKPNFYIPRSSFHTERYGHWRLYDERFQTDVFRI